MLYSYSSVISLWPSKGFLGNVRKGHLFHGNKGQILKRPGEQRHAILGNREHKIFVEQVNLFQGPGRREQVPPSTRESLITIILYVIHNEFQISHFHC